MKIEEIGIDNKIDNKHFRPEFRFFASIIILSHSVFDLFFTVVKK